MPACQGSPACSHAVLGTLFDCSPACVTHPPITCSTSGEHSVSVPEP
ncbi:hypothetical protein GFS60_07739 (plasmid) [Rhodococcus sp. WAY2]|nr:hypothetical protein GFS60_07739 [Rhodococcus sp. WAY2]